MDGHSEPKSTEELAAYIQSTLSNLQTKFTNISDGILSKVDNMSSRIDGLERSIAELMTASGVEISENGLTPRNWYRGFYKIIFLLLEEIFFFILRIVKKLCVD